MEHYRNSPPPPPPLARLATLLAALALLLGLAGTAGATSTCTAPFQYKGKPNDLTPAESEFLEGAARYIVNPTYPHTPCARLCQYITPVPGQVCPQLEWANRDVPFPRPTYCSSDPQCQGFLSSQQVSERGCDPAEDAREEGLVVDLEENSELITMNLQHWEKDMNLAGKRYSCLLGETGLR